MSETTAIAAPRIFDGARWLEDAAVIVDDGLVAAIVAAPDVHPRIETVALRSGVLAPGFVDLQVNGGGGALFNDDPSPSTIATICAAHLALGTTAMLATFISDAPATTQAAIDAGVAARRARVPGFLGLHLEGPHLAKARAGAHDPAHLRAMEEADLETLLAARARLEVLMVTVAPECVTDAQISRLAEAGVVVSLGHSEASYERACQAAQAGASAVTHLFNAMPPLAHRAPGLVGAALETGALDASIIADGRHVDAAAIAIAIRGKRGPGAVFAVSDAMPTVGADLEGFELGGRPVRLADGALRFDDGTLAGAHLSMAGAVRFLRDHVGIETQDALRMATVSPARVARMASIVGSIAPGARADFVHLDEALEVRAVWHGGVPA